MNHEIHEMMIFDAATVELWAVRHKLHWREAQTQEEAVKSYLWWNRIQFQTEGVIAKMPGRCKKLAFSLKCHNKTLTSLQRVRIQKKYDHMINYIWWVYLCNHDMGLALCSDLISSHVSNSDHNTYMRLVIHIFHYGDNFLPTEEIIVSITQFIKIMRIKCFDVIR